MSNPFELRGPPLLQPLGFFLIGLPFTICGVILLGVLVSKAQPPFLLWLATLLFLASGTPLLWMAYRQRQHHKKIAQWRRENPDEPWLWFETWRADTMDARWPAKAINITVMALFWNALSLPLVFSFTEPMGRSWQLGLMIGSFPLIGIILIYLALTKWLGRRKLGAAKLRLLTKPGVLGGQFLARFSTSSNPDLSRQLVASLEAVQRKVVSDQRRKVILESSLFKEDQILQAKPFDLDPNSEPGFSADIAFQIPYSCRQTQVTGKTIQVHWILTITESSNSLMPLNLEFPVPIFKTSISSPQIEEREAHPGAMNEAFESGTLRRSGIKLLPQSEGSLLIEYPSRRHLPRILGLFSSSGFLFIMAYFLMGLDELPMIPGLFVCLLALVFLFGGLIFCLSSMSIQVSTKGIHRRKTGFLGSKRDFTPKGEIKDVEFLADHPTRSQLNYKIEAQLIDHSRLNLGRRINDKESARVLISFIERALGINI